MNEQDTHAATLTQRDVLNAFSRSLNREAHVLTQHPELLWQKLYNSLQCKSKEALLVYCGYQKSK